MMNKSRKACIRSLAAALGIVALTSLPAVADEYRDLVKTGKEAFQSQCLNCHKTVEEATAGYRTKSDWQKLVADMVVRGSKLDAGQQAAVVEYLIGRGLLMSQCRTCHAIQRPLTANKSYDDWKSTVERMAQKMPPNLKLSPERIEKIAGFLAVERPLP